MLSTQRERENFYRISTIIVDHGKESLALLLDNELNSSNKTLEDFINLNQHAIYHLYLNRCTCCQCINGKVPIKTPASRVLHQDQLNILLDKYGQKLAWHNIKSVEQFCCCPAKTTITTKHLDLTLLRCLLINFASIYSQNSNIRLAVDGLIGYRNKLYGHAEEARCLDTDYILYKNQIETVILTIAKSCNKEAEMKQKLKDAEVRPLDETICQQYQMCLLRDIQQNEDIRMEINLLREQSRQNNDQNVHHILELENKVTTSISSYNKAITETMENMQLNLSRRDEIIYEKLQSYGVKLVDEVHNHYIEVNRTVEKERDVLQRRKHEELIEHLHQTELSVRSKVEETMEGVLTNTDQTRREIQDIIDNLSGHLKDTVTICPETLGKLDSRRQNLIDHSNAIINSHREDQTFVETCGLKEARHILNAQNLLILLAKAGSGKTQIALHLASQYQAEGYIPFLFSDQDIMKYRDLIPLDEKYIVIVEDLFGRTSVDFSENKHRNILDTLSSCLKRSTLLKMVFTIRNDPKCEENILAKHDIFHRKRILNLDNDFKLSYKERYTILLSHLRYKSITQCKGQIRLDLWLDYDGLPFCSSECTSDVKRLSCGKIQICTETISMCCSFDTYIGFPEACRLFCHDESLTFLGAAYFRDTSQSLVNKVDDLYSESFEKLSSRYQYCVLVYTALKHNLLDHNSIGYHKENDELFQKIFNKFDGKETKVKKKLVQQAIRQLEGGYLMECSRFNEFYPDYCPHPVINAYMFKHPAIYDAVLISFGNECPEMLLNLDNCNINFFLQYIRPSSKLPEPKSPVIHVDPKLVIDKLCVFLENDISYKNLKDEDVKTVPPWLPPPIDDQHDEYNNQDERKFDENDGTENTVDVNSALGLQTDDKSDSENKNDDVIMGRVVTHLFVCRNPEMIGEYIRKCIIERYVSFVKLFFERLSILSPTPEQMMKFLNGLTRRGTCLVNLTINSDIIRDCAFKYADAKILCLIFRPQSSSIKTDKFYQLDDQLLQDKLFSIIEENEIYKTIQEIGNFLYRVGVEEGNYEFVKTFLNSVIKRYNNIENDYKIRYIIDGMTGKGMRTDVVIPFIQFLHDNLIPFGSIKTIIALWKVITPLLYENANDNAPVMAIIEQKFRAHLLFDGDLEEGVNYQVQTQEYGSCVYNLGMEIQDNEVIEELILRLINIYHNTLRLYSTNRLDFLFYFFIGFTNFQARQEDAEKMCPSGMEKLYCHMKRFKLFRKKLNEANKPYTYDQLRILVDILIPKSSDGYNDDN